MSVELNLSGLRQTKWHEYLVRFVFGGLVTVATGMVARMFGPVVGGLFLAFPAIFPASVTLVSTHAKERNGGSDAQCDEQSEQEAAFDAGGAAIGSIGLLGFALIVWWLGQRLSPSLVLLLAFGAWGSIAVVMWKVLQPGDGERGRSERT